MPRVETFSMSVKHRSQEEIEQGLVEMHESLFRAGATMLGSYVLKCTVNADPNGELEFDDPSRNQMDERLFLVTSIPALSDLEMDSLSE